MARHTAAFPEVAYVLDVFIKKSKCGIKTPKADIERVRQRFAAAKRHYEENYGQRGDR